MEITALPNSRRVLLQLIALPFLLWMFGCHSLSNQSERSERPTFYESEISSRTWITPRGAKVVFLTSTLTNVTGFGEIKIAQFGDIDTKQARCLEIYEAKPQIPSDSDGERSFLLLDHDWGPSEQWRWDSIVISIDTVVHSGKVTFRIVREGNIPDGSGRKRVLYFLDYKKTSGVTMNTSQWVSPVLRDGR